MIDGWKNASSAKALALVDDTIKQWNQERQKLKNWSHNFNFSSVKCKHEIRTHSKNQVPHKRGISSDNGRWKIMRAFWSSEEKLIRCDFWGEYFFFYTSSLKDMFTKKKR